VGVTEYSGVGPDRQQRDREWCSVLTCRWCLLASGRVAAGGFRKLVIQALNFSVLFGEFLVGGELVLRKLLGERGKVLLKRRGLCLLLCQCGIVDLLVKRGGHTPVMFGAATGAGCFCLLILPVPDNAARSSCAAKERRRGWPAACGGFSGFHSDSWAGVSVI
jgi:hypothetical protein